MIDPDLAEILANCAEAIGVEQLEDETCRELSQVFSLLSSSIPPEEVQEAIEKVWFAARLELRGGG